MFDNERVLEMVRRLRVSAMECADTPAWSLSDADVVACLDTVHRAEQALAAVKLHLIRQAETRDIPAAHHAYSTVSWLRNRLHVSPRVAARAVALARAADLRPGLDQGLVDGQVDVEQAAVISACLTALPAEVRPEAVDKAETLLIAYAADFDPKGLRHLGARILEHVAPEIADRLDAAALDRLEHDAHRSRSFLMSPPDNGRVRFSGSLDVEAAAIVSAALDPLCSPRTWWATIPGNGSAGDGSAGDGSAGDRGPGVAPDGRTVGQRYADALVEVCRLTLRTGDLPISGGQPPQLTVTVGYERLRAELAAGHADPLRDLLGLDSADPLGPGAAHPAHPGAAHTTRPGTADPDIPHTAHSGTADPDAARTAHPGTAPTAHPRTAHSGDLGAVPGVRSGTAGSDRPGSDPPPTPPFPFAGSGAAGPPPGRRFGVGTLGSGQRVSPSTVRRLACDAEILPVVLGTDGQVLDVGRAKRLFDGYVRRALVARDRGCAFPGCDLPARWCEGHHLRSWADGGPTSLDNAVLLCRGHHRLVHTGDWAVRLAHDGLPEFVPAAHVDAHRRPRRNQYHRRT